MLKTNERGKLNKRFYKTQIHVIECPVVHKFIFNLDGDDLQQITQ